MTVLFEHRSRVNNRMVMRLKSGQDVVFIDGVFQTTDKDIVKNLVAHPFYKRGKFSMKTDEKIVGEWLENDKEPSYMTKEMIAGISNEAIMELGEVLELRNAGNLPLLKAELVGQPVSDTVTEIIEQYKTRTASKTRKTTAKKLETN